MIAKLGWNLVLFAGVGVASFALTVDAAASANTPYAEIAELKAWDKQIDVHFKNGQEHSCPGGLKTRFLLNPAREAQYSLLMGAFLGKKQVSLSYTCGTDGRPWIDGVRVK